MKFTEHKDPTINMIRRIEADAIWVNETPVRTSFYMSARHLQPNWTPKSVETLTREHLDALLALQPEVVILGTGSTQQFLPPHLQAYVLQQGVGLEVMSNDAACRTWNVLTTEDRPVVLGIILPSDATA